MIEAARGARLGPLRHRNFRLFFLGQAVSLPGTWMQQVALGWLVLELTDSPFYVGLAAALGSAGVLLFTLYAGVVADRTDKRRTIVVTQTLQMLQAFALAALVWSGAATIQAVLALAAFLGLVSAFDIPMRQSFVVEMVGRDDLVTAIALNSSVFNAARTLGPALAGVLIGALGVGICFLLNGVSFLAVIAGLVAMRLPPAAPRPPGPSAWAGFLEILRHVRGERRLATLVALTALLSLCGFPFLPLMPVFARDVLHTDPRGYGALTAAVGLGAMVGALGVVLVGRRAPKGRLLVTAGTTFGLLLAAFAASRALPVAIGLLALVGCAMIVNNALTNALLQTLVPDRLRGRVMGLYSFVFVGMAPLGALVAGVVAERYGAPWAVGAGGLASAAGVLLAAWRVPELYRET